MSISSSIGKTCPYCQTPIKPEAEVVICTACGMPHHRECWHENQRCTTFGCAGAPSAQPGAEQYVQPISTSIPPPPPMAVAYTPVQSPIPQDLYIEGKQTLIVRDGASLPPVCVISGKDGNLVERKRTESWAPPWVVALIVFGLLICAIVYLCVKKTGKIFFYLERESAARRVKLILMDWGLVLLLLAAGIIAIPYESTVVLGIILVLACIIVPAIIYYIAIQLYSVQKIDRGYIWIKFRKPEIAQAIYAAYLEQQRML